MIDRPLRVFLYRDWCWVCRVCKGADYGYRSQPAALSAALHHCDKGLADMVARRMDETINRRAD